MKRDVAVFVFPGVQALDVSGPLDVLAEANRLLSPDEGYRSVLVGADHVPFRASNGMLLAADMTFDEAVADFDLVLVPGGPDLPRSPPDEALIRCVRRLTRESGQYGSICTGAFILGHAGLLAGRSVTTHWQDAQALAALFPDADVMFDRIYVVDGRLLTSAGVTAGIDLALAIVARDHGVRISLAVAKRLVVIAQRQGGQSQFSPYLAATAGKDSSITQVLAYVMAHLGDRLTVDDLAEQAGVSPRSLARMFEKEVHCTPGEFVEHARLDAARNQLEGSDAAMKTIAFSCGFGSVARMRLTFQRSLGITPNQYRASFNTASEGPASASTAPDGSAS